MLQVAMHWLGFGLCHQLAERSFFGGGVQLPVCARDTGIYVGFVVSYLLIAVLDRGRHRFGAPPAWVIAVAVLLFGSMVWDGVTSYAGLRETTNLLRLVTGTAAGFALALVIAPILNGQLWRSTTAGGVLSEWWAGAVWTIAVPATAAAVLYGGPRLGVFYPLVVAACILATFTMVNLVIVVLVPRFERGAARLRDLVAPIGIALGVTLVEIALAAGLRLVLLSLVSRG